jgi:hypothetical protein
MTTFTNNYIGSIENYIWYVISFYDWIRMSDSVGILLDG